MPQAPRVWTSTLRMNSSASWIEAEDRHSAGYTVKDFGASVKLGFKIHPNDSGLIQGHNHIRVSEYPQRRPPVRQVPERAVPVCIVQSHCSCQSFIPRKATALHDIELPCAMQRTEQERIRRESLAALRAHGIEPYPAAEFTVTHRSKRLAAELKTARR